MKNNAIRIFACVVLSTSLLITAVLTGTAQSDIGTPPVYCGTPYDPEVTTDGRDWEPVPEDGDGDTITSLPSTGVGSGATSTGGVVSGGGIYLA